MKHLNIYILIFTAFFHCVFLLNQNHSQASNKELIAFGSEQNGTGIDHFEVCIMNPYGSEQIRLTNNSVYDGQPSLSPKGDKLVFLSTRDGNYEIYTMKLDATDLRRLTFNDAWDFSPKWSPDGNKIVFCSFRAGNGDIFVMDADGNNLQQLTTNLAIDDSPDWSPDGNQIAFSSDRGGNKEIYIINSDGDNLEQVTYLGYENYQVDWSPNGQKLAFVTDKFTHGMGYDVCTINIDGTDFNRLTAHSGNDEFPEWSPDGTKIAFASSQLDAKEIHLMEADGSNLEVITDNPGFDFPHDWVEFSISNVRDKSIIKSKKFSLNNNYPNPFNPNTTIRYRLSDIGYVKLKIYDELGKTIETLVDQEQKAGNYSVNFDASKLSSSIYYYRIQVDGYQETKTMVLLK